MRPNPLIAAVGATTALMFGQASHVSEPKDPFGLLAKQMERGEAKLSYDSNGRGYFDLQKRLFRYPCLT